MISARKSKFLAGLTKVEGITKSEGLPLKKASAGEAGTVSAQGRTSEAEDLSSDFLAGKIAASFFNGKPER